MTLHEVDRDRQVEIADCIIAAIEAYDKPPTWSEICCEIDQTGNDEHWDPTWIVRVMHQMKKDGRLTESLLANSNGRSVWALTKPDQESASGGEN